MIRCENISYSTPKGICLVQPMRFEAQAGQVTAILGPNGAGKSTLLKLLSGTLRPTSGKVWFQGRDLLAWNPLELARHRSVMAQHTQLSAPFTVREVVHMGRYPHFSGRPSPEDEGIVEEALNRVGIRALAGRNIQHLSGGEQQLVHLARVLAQIWQTPASPAGLLLLDEPVSSLDIHFQHRILSIAHGLADQGMAIVAILHDLNLATAYAHHWVVMQRGAKVWDEPLPQALREEAISTFFDAPLRFTRQGGSGFWHYQAPISAGETPIPITSHIQK